MAGLPRLWARISERCHRVCKAVRSLYQDSPFVFALVLVVLLLLISIGSLFSIIVSHYLGPKGTLLVDLSLVWLFARLVARVLLFPGSLKLFQRNTEATFRAEMARQYAHFLRQLLIFLRHAARQSESILRGVSADGIVRGYSVIETLTSTFRMQQQQHGVRLSSEQCHMQAIAQDVERWMKGAQISEGVRQSSPGQPVPLMEWLRRQAASNGHSQSLLAAELVGSQEEALRCIEMIEQLLVELDELRHQNKGLFATVMRFIRVPAVGSLNQLRAELQMRYGGQRCWVRTRGGHKIDAMFIPCDGAAQATCQDEAQPEDAPLKASGRGSPFAGPTIVWCNPNAAYYETMVYQASWLNFWLSHGCNLFLFNYSGYGQSSGLPSPSRIADDGDSIIAFLKSKGITKIGVYGRSIGGVTACHLARKHPDVVQLLIADRTMSQLQAAARYLYGGWAAKGLHITRMVHNNVDNYWEVRCYKLLVVDPKDTMILELAALRTAVAMRVIQQMLPGEYLEIAEDRLAGLAEVWRFFQTLFAICEKDDEGLEAALGGRGEDAGRPARQPIFVRDEPRSDCRVKLSDSSSSISEGQNAGKTMSTRERVTLQWLQENAAAARTAMAPFVDQVRSALDIVGEQLEGGGTTFNDVFLDNPSDPVGALRCFLANLQVWGTLGDPREDYDQQWSGAPNAQGQPVAEREIEQFLRKDFSSEYMPHADVSPQRLRELGEALAPDTLATYHRRLTRARVAHVRREFRRRLSTLQHAFAQSGGGSEPAAAEPAKRLLRTVLGLLGEVESFVSSLGRFFKNVDLSLPYSRQQGQTAAASDGLALPEPPLSSDSSDEKCADPGPDTLQPGALAPQPAVDHAAAGYIMHVDCGHNGALDEVDLRQLALHLRAARFGQATSNS